MDKLEIYQNNIENKNKIISNLFNIDNNQEYENQNNTNGLEGYLQQQTTTENTQIDLNNLFSLWI